MKNFIESKFVKEVSEITSNMYRQGWDERNGGNISYLIEEAKTTALSALPVSLSLRKVARYDN